jgi:hypothetical protein
MHTPLTAPPPTACAHRCRAGHAPCRRVHPPHLAAHHTMHHTGPDPPFLGILFFFHQARSPSHTIIAEPSPPPAQHSIAYPLRPSTQKESALSPWCSPAISHPRRTPELSNFQLFPIFGELMRHRNPSSIYHHRWVIVLILSSLRSPIMSWNQLTTSTLLPMTEMATQHAAVHRPAPLAVEKRLETLLTSSSLTPSHSRDPWCSPAKPTSTPPPLTVDGRHCRAQAATSLMTCHYGEPPPSSSCPVHHPIDARALGARVGAVPFPSRCRPPGRSARRLPMRMLCHASHFCRRSRPVVLGLRPLWT